METLVGTAQTHDGIALRTLGWPATPPAWASLLIVHGLGEHAGRYEHVARQMADAGIDVGAYDHRGFGGSGGPRAYLRRWSDLHDDLEARLAAARAAVPAFRSSSTATRWVGSSRSDTCWRTRLGHSPTSSF
jgi:alpha-beta hydrolase superfamily lysophospholipase